MIFINEFFSYMLDEKKKKKKEGGGDKL